MSLRRLLTGNRQFRVGRVVGRRTVFRSLFWSVVAVVVLTVYRTPTLLDGPLTAGAVLSVLPYALIPVVVAVVTAAVVLFSALGEIRYVLFGDRRGRGPDDSYQDDTDGGLFDGFGGFGGFGGDGGGDDE